MTGVYKWLLRLSGWNVVHIYHIYSNNTIRISPGNIIIELTKSEMQEFVADLARLTRNMES